MLFLGDCIALVMFTGELCYSTYTQKEHKNKKSTQVLMMPSLYHQFKFRNLFKIEECKRYSNAFITCSLKCHFSKEKACEDTPSPIIKKSIIPVIVDSCANKNLGT